MKVGLFFGSFNPVHNGHLIIANHLLNHTDLDKIWFIVSPQNPFKEAAGLLNEYHRLQLLKLATEDDNRIKSIRYRIHAPRPLHIGDIGSPGRKNIPNMNSAWSWAAIPFKTWIAGRIMRPSSITTKYLFTAGQGLTWTTGSRQE